MAGACIGAFLSFLFYPLNVVKVTMQSHLGGPFQSIFATFKYVYNDRDRKIRKVYKGVGTNSAKAFLSWGILNSAYEYFKKVFGNKADTQI
jgi:hypothetical protein